MIVLNKKLQKRIAVKMLDELYKFKNTEEKEVEINDFKNDLRYKMAKNNGKMSIEIIDNLTE